MLKKVFCTSRQPLALWLLHFQEYSREDVPRTSLKGYCIPSLMLQSWVLRRTIRNKNGTHRRVQIGALLHCSATWLEFLDYEPWTKKCLEKVYLGVYSRERYLRTCAGQHWAADRAGKDCSTVIATAPADSSALWSCQELRPSTDLHLSVTGPRLS